MHDEPGTDAGERPVGAGDDGAVDGHRPGDWGGDPVPDAGALRALGVVESPARRMRAARAAVATVAVLAVVEGLTSAWALWETRSVAGDEPTGDDTRLDALTVGQDAIDRLNAATGVDGVVTSIGVLALVVSAVLVIRWENVVLRNQRGLGVARPRYSPVAAGLSWFVPIWSLFGPKRAMNDAWCVAAPAGADRTAIPALFAWWWGAWLVSVIVGGGVARVSGDTLGGNTALYVGSLVACVATVVAGALFVSVMEGITRRHDDRIAERARPAA